MSDRPIVARLRSRGHRSIRATHDSTWELAVDTDITARATCVIGVATEVVEGSLDALAGPITIELDIDGHSWSVDAIANPERIGTDAGLVVRRSGARLADTLATGAPGGATDLDRSWVPRLSDPSAVLVVTIRRRARRPDGRPQLIIGRATDRHDRRRVAEAEAAGAVVAEDQRPASVDLAMARARGVLETGGRALVVASTELVGRTVPALVDGLVEPVVIETFGLSPSLAVAAALGGSAPVAIGARASTGAEIDRRLAAMGDGSRVVAVVPASRLGLVIGAVAESTTVAVMVDADQPSERVVRFVARDAAEPVDELPSRGDVVVGLASNERAADPSVRPEGLLGALVDAGVAPTTITRALAQLPGWSRNRAYRAVMDAPSP